MGCRIGLLVLFGADDEGTIFGGMRGVTSDEEAAASDARGYLADDPASFLPVLIGGVFF